MSLASSAQSRAAEGAERLTASVDQAPEQRAIQRNGPTTVGVSRRRLSLTTGLQLVARAVAAALGAVLAATLARALGPMQFGHLSIALMLASIAGNVGDFGLAQVAVREMASSPSRRPPLLGALIALRFVSGVVLATCFGLVAALLISDTEPRRAAFWILLTLPLGAITALQTAAQVRLRPELTAFLLLLQSGSWLVIVVLLAQRHASLSAYGIGFLATNIMLAITTWFSIRRLTIISFPKVRKHTFQLLRLAWPLGVAGLFVTAYYRLDSIIVYQAVGPVPAAHYAAAYRFLDFLQILPVTGLTILLPVISALRGGQAGNPQIARLYQAALVIAAAFALPLVAGGVLLAPKLVDLVYGPSFSPASRLLAVLLPSFISISFGYVLSGLLVAADQVRFIGLTTATAAIINIAASLLLVPKHGAMAAAILTVVTEYSVTTVFLLKVTRIMGVSPPWTRIVRCLVATCVMGWITYLLRSLPIAVNLVVSAAIYGACLLATRTFKRSDLRLVLGSKGSLRA